MKHKSTDSVEIHACYVAQMWLLFIRCSILASLTSLGSCFMLSRQANSHTQLRDLPFYFTVIQTLDIPTVAVASLSAAAIGFTKFLGDKDLGIRSSQYAVVLTNAVQVMTAFNASTRELMPLKATDLHDLIERNNAEVMEAMNTKFPGGYPKLAEFASLTPADTEIFEAFKWRQETMAATLVSANAQAISEACVNFRKVFRLKMLEKMQVVTREMVVESGQFSCTFLNEESTLLFSEELKTVVLDIDQLLK